VAIGKHELTLFDVDPCASEKLASELGGTKLGGTRVAVAKPPADGVPESDIVILASWFLANVETATQLGAGLQGKAVVEISNPLN
jgi:predicted dinucleotide-binding enzyme